MTRARVQQVCADLLGDGLVGAAGGVGLSDRGVQRGAPRGDRSLGAAHVRGQSAQAHDTTSSAPVGTMPQNDGRNDPVTPWSSEVNVASATVSLPGPWR